MRLSRQSRVFAAIVALVSVLFTQLAVASYLCPSAQIAQALAAAVVHQQQSGCEVPDTAEKPTACHDLGQSRIQSLDKAELPNVAPFTATLLVQSVSHAEQPVQSILPLNASLFLTRATAPPLSIRNCCFRI